MRILTALSGILLALGGAFCFVYNTNAFSDVAFVMGLAMLLAGILSVIAYIVSGKSRRLPDTFLVENIVNILFGFAVLNNQVPDDIISVFFGSWLVLAGATRLTQGVAISRFNSRDWVRVLPLGAVCALLGATMMMPTLVSTMNAMVLVGAAFILNGLSQMILSMYIYQKPAEKAIAAKERADAKKAASKAKRDQRKMLRDLSEQEREEMLARERESKKKNKLKKQKAIQEEKQARKDAKRDPKSVTVQLTVEEVAEIARLADESASIPEEAVKLDDEQLSADDAAPVIETVNTPEDPAGTEASAADAPAAETEEAAEGVKLWPEFKRPEAIPSLREIRAAGSEDAQAEDSTEQPRIAAINIAEIESGDAQVVFDPVELPEVTLASEVSKAVDRNELLSELGSAVRKEAPEANYEALSLDELINEPIKSRMNEEKDRERFTTTFSFSWEELEKKLAEVDAEKKKADETYKKWS